VKARTIIYRTLLACFVPAGSALAQENNTELAKAAQNPVASMISLPFQNNFNFGLGPYDRTQYLLNIQPVIPLQLSRNWNLIARTIIPVLYQPDLFPAGQKR